MTEPACRTLVGFCCLVAATFAVAPRAAAQSQLHPRWEILRAPNGVVLDFAPDGGWRVKARKVAAYRKALMERGEFVALNAPVVFGAYPSPAVVQGVEKVPALLFRFADVGTGTTNAAPAYDQVLFGAIPPAGRPYSIRTLYEQMSTIGSNPPLLSIQGQVVGWITLLGNETQYTGDPATDNCSGNPFGGNSCNGLFSGSAQSKMINGLNQVLLAADTGTFDWGQFDNDGPDGSPNSGDDNGIVDQVIFIHSEQDGACGPSSNNHLWSHRGSGLTYTTHTDRIGFPGQKIRVRDYTLQSGVGGSNSCTTAQLMPVGTAAHETGHAFGLPDLYDVQGTTEGIGQWGLMGSGNYTSPFSPTRMEAWSLNQLGWITVAPLTSNGTYSFGPVPTSDSTFLIRVQGTNTRGEHYLLENRQASQADTAMIRAHCGNSGLSYPTNCHGGLAIWHVDSTKIKNSGFGGTNTVNGGNPHGLLLVQADGLGQLEKGSGGGGNRGNAGDVWPGYGSGTPKTVYSVETSPKAVANDSTTFPGFQIDQITQTVTDGPMSFRLTFGFKLQVAVSGSGTVSSSPSYTLTNGAFVDKNTTVTVTATPTGSGVFNGWTGDTTASANPLTLTMARNYLLTANFAAGPLTVTSGAPPGGQVGKAYNFTLTASGGSSGNYSWQVASGSLPTGLTLSTAGVIGGTPSAAGSFSATARVTSGAQTADATVAITVTEPTIVLNNALNHLLGISSVLTADEIGYLDFIGNKSGGTYDVGDFLAWVNKTNATPASPPEQGRARRVKP
ncbi:MAG: M6 family metalloprotease domain-containing protein [Gemmatimonadetes bacterium]|nr:M6 family metalloprotease domain-containing protein [Gemmatimonadota bacterium]